MELDESFPFFYPRFLIVSGHNIFDLKTETRVVNNVFYCFSVVDGKTGLGPSDIKSTTSDVETIIKKGTLLPTDWTLSQRLTYRGGGHTNDPATTTAGKSYNHQTISGAGKKSGGGGRGQDAEDKLLAVRGRSASEPSFLSASRAVKVRVSSAAADPSSYTPPTVKGEFFCFHFSSFQLSIGEELVKKSFPTVPKIYFVSFHFGE